MKMFDEERMAYDLVLDYGRGGKDRLILSHDATSHDYEHVIDYNSKQGDGWGMHNEGPYGCSREGHTVNGNGGPFVYDATRQPLFSMMSAIDIDEFVVWYMTQELST